MQGVFCQEENFAKGPLFGKNLYIPYLIHYNFPSLPASAGQKFDFTYHTSVYFVQDAGYIENYSFPSGGERSYDTRNIHRDYESIVGEIGFTFNPLRNLQVGTDFRLIAYYHGFWDPVVEVFHRIFKFPNGGREFFLQNQLYVNIPNDNGIRLYLDDDAVTFGDIDLWTKWTFYEALKVSLALLGAFKAPTGKLDALSGSGYPDAAIGLLSDIKPLWYLSVYVQAGVVFPFDKQSRVMFNGLAGVEFHPLKLFSVNLQMNIKTPPISGEYYSYPQTNLLVGFVFDYKDFRWQFFLEEDPFTYQGADITFSLMFAHTLHLGARKRN